MPRDGLLLAIDGGQTATKSLLARLDGEVLAAGRGGPFDHFHSAQGTARNRAAIRGAIGSALAAAEAAPEKVVSVALGLTGVFSGVDSTPLVAPIVREVLDPSRVTAVADFVTNLTGASGGEPGVVVIAGGGAIAYGVTADGREAVSSGFGYLIGDEGSAFDIGRRAVAAATRASDGRDPPTAWVGGVTSTFGLAGMREVTRVVYGEGFSRDRLSTLAPLVVEAARAGDAAANRIVTTAGEELAGAALAVIRQLHRPGTPVAVYPTGGVFRAGAILLEPFRAALRRGWPEASDRAPAYPPVVGALILARRAIGLEPDAGWLAAVAASLPKVDR